MPCAAVHPAMAPLLPARLASQLARNQRTFAAAAHTTVTAAQQQPLPAGSAPPTPPAATAAGGLSVVATSPSATQLLAHFFACTLQPADCYLLYGSVGAGKSYFSRAFIRAAAQDDELPVPSPTFLLQNIYSDHRGPPIHHFDLYRLTQQYDLHRLDLPTSFAQAVSLVEWPERLQLLQGSEADAHMLPQQHLAVTISILHGKEQEQLAQQRRWQQGGEADGRRLHGANSSSSSSNDGSGGRGVALGQQEIEEEEEEEGSGDLRWRRIRLEAAGPRWGPRLQLLQRYLRELRGAGDELGCFLEGDPGC